MARTVVKVEGLKELDRALAELTAPTAKNVARRTLKKAAKPIADAAQSKAPDGDTGKLKIATGEGTTLSARQRSIAGRAARVTAGPSGPIFRGRKGLPVEVYVGPRKASPSDRAPAPSGLFQEFGTDTNSPQPFLRPAWDGNKLRALEIIKSELGGEIAAAAARAAKKALKAKG